MSDILSQEELDALLAQVRQQEQDQGPGANEPAPPPRAKAVAPSPARAAAPGPAPAVIHDEGSNLELILNLPLELSVELGRTRMTLHELLQLGQGSVIELNRMASDHIDLTVHGRVIANGEAVVVNESFGFRVHAVDSVQARIKKL
ncbi:flagellar motor switch protein FliN [Myxococcota bacterium]|nr:flagellar motor switch protein FliN [Myxococcota bacterium]